MSVLEKAFNQKFVQKQAGYEVKPHPIHKRMYHIELNEDRLREFFDFFAKDKPQTLEYIPYMRYNMAGKLNELTSEIQRRTQCEDSGLGGADESGMGVCAA